MTTAHSIAIVGGGQMGLVLADALAAAGHHARIWGPHPERIRTLAETRRSDRLPGFRLPDAVAVTSDDARALADADVIVNAVPTQFIRSAWARVASGKAGNGGVAGGAPVLCVSKGLERGTRLRPTEIIAHALGDDPATPRSMAALSGPTIAAELARHLPATMVAASTDDTLTDLAQRLFAVEWLRIYRHDDLVGVEIAGAAKNV
ncbi:MAG: NAD(P)-binding domain-containing protein, partial [Phycisphaerae bacterium]|nr:NAD(P)-binding domain-containing protein [Phycisphaerae bacterium]